MPEGFDFNLETTSQLERVISPQVSLEPVAALERESQKEATRQLVINNVLPEFDLTEELTGNGKPETKANEKPVEKQEKKSWRKRSCPDDKAGINTDMQKSMSPGAGCRIAKWILKQFD